MVALVDDEDYERLSVFNWYYKRNKNVDYAVRQTGWKKTLVRTPMQREVLPPPPGFLVDHINGNGLDNRKCNLRLCTVAQNGYNRQKNQKQGSKPTSSRFKGVSWEKGPGYWTSKIRVNQKLMHLGVFDNEEDAAIHYNIAAQLFFGEFARLNPEV